MPALRYTAISKSLFNDILSRYPSTVPDKLRDLDPQRYDTIPAKLAERKHNNTAAAHLSKDEVEKLVEWKLKHGTFRPKLLQLVQSNPAALIEDTVRKAFAVCSSSSSSFSLESDSSSSSPLDALQILTQLKGVGPATASLLLAVGDPDAVPFFSDELFRWLMWDEKGAPGGWKRVIRYNKKEYDEVLGRVRELRERLGVGAVECEKVAWVLGREGVDVGAGPEEGEGEGEGGRTAAKDEQDAGSRHGKGKAEGLKGKQGKRGAKRKVEIKQDEDPEGVRRSSRRKTTA